MKRGRKFNAEIAARNAEIAVLFRDRHVDLCDIAPRYELSPGAVANILRNQGISTRMHKPGPKTAPPPPMVRRVPNPALGTYPLGIQSPPGVAFCDQCDRLRKPEEAAACRSQWCSLKRAGGVA